MKSLLRPLTAPACGLLLLLGAGVAQAQTVTTTTTGPGGTTVSTVGAAPMAVAPMPASEELPPDDSPSAGAMVVDLILIRPVSLVATLLGSVLFIVQLPLDLIQNTPPVNPAQKLVVEPARYTFTRPLGQMEY